VVTVTFSEAMRVSTLTTSTIQLRRTFPNTLVSATVTYNAATRTATLDPIRTLADNTTYTATVVGGSNGVKDVAGNALATNFTRSFRCHTTSLTPRPPR
jgi:hypothetical protein